VKRIDDRSALWIGTEAEAHIEPTWHLRVPAQAAGAKNPVLP